MRTHFIFIFLFIPLFVVAQTGIIKTVAGNGNVKTSGDGGCALLAGVGATGGVACDYLGNYYITGGSDMRIRRISATGVITTYAGTGTAGYSGDLGPATNATLRAPSRMAFDSHNNMYFTDQNNHAIRKIDASSGIITTLAGDGIPGFTGDNGPASIARLNNPIGLCFDKFGNLYITDHSNFRIRKIDVSGIITTIAGDGVNNDAGDTGPATSAELSNMFGLCVDDTGNIYISSSSVIRKISVASGIITRFAGTYISGFSGDGGPANLAKIGGAYDVAFDTSNHSLLIADMSFNNIRKVNSYGIITTEVGDGSPLFKGDGGPATISSIWSPRGIAVDSAGDIYISDNGHNRIRKVTYSSTPIQTINISVTPNDTVCAGTSVLVSSIVSGISSPSYNWYVNGVSMGPGSSSFSFVPSDGDSIFCAINSGSSCLGITLSNVIHFTVYPTTASIGITASPNDTVCAGTSVTYSSAISGGGALLPTSGM